MLAKGKYAAKPINWTLGYTSNGKEEVAVELAFVDPGLEVSALTWYGFFGDNSIEITIKALRIMGWTGVDLATLLEPDALDTVADVEVVVDHEEYPQGSGKWSARIKFINSPGGIAVKSRMSPESARTFAARMRGAVAGVDARTGQKSAGRSPTAGCDEPPPRTDEDIPF